MRKFIIAAVAILLTATTTFAATRTAPAPSQSIVDRIVAKLNADGQKLVDDINAADAIAVANNDTIAHACYPAEVKFLQSLQGLPKVPAGAGIVTAFEIKRVLGQIVKKGLPDYLVIGCAPLMQDEATIFIKIMGQLGIAISLPAGGLAGLATLFGA